MQMETNKQKSSGSNTCIRKNRLKTKAINNNKKGHYITIKESIQEDNKIFVNIYVPNIEALKYIKQI